MTTWVPSRPGGTSPGPESLERLVAEIRRLQKDWKSYTRTPQLTSSSIDDGSLALVTGGDVAGYVGTQYDGTTGTVTVTGPTPPIPSMPELTSVLGGIRVRWDGTFEDPQPGYTSPVVAPMTMKAVEVHLSTEPEFDAAGFTTMRGAITSLRGGDFTDSSFTPGTMVYGCLVSRDQSGKVSAQSVTAGPVAAGQVGLGDLGFDLSDYTGGTTIYYGGDPPTVPAGGFTEGDLWLRDIGSKADGTRLYQTYRWLLSGWALLEPQGISDALAQAVGAYEATLNKATVFYQGSRPQWSGSYGSAVWYDTANDRRRMVWTGTDWAVATIGTGAITPNSLVASSVIATGTVTAALLEAQLVLASVLIAGTANGDHARLQSDGLKIYRLIVGEGLQLAGRFGVGGAGGFLAFVNSDGEQVAGIDELGGASFTDLYVDGDPTFDGVKLSAMLSEQGNNLVGHWGGNISGLEQAGNIGIGSTEYGIAQVTFPAVAGHSYRVRWRIPFWYVTEATGEVWKRLLYRMGSPPTPTTNAECGITLVSGYPANSWQLEPHFEGYIEAPSTGTCYVDLVMRHAWDSTTSVLKIVEGAWTEADVYDLGATTDIPGNQIDTYGSLKGGSGGGGGNPPVQYYWEQAAGSRHATYRGNRSYRSDTTDVVQGWDPSGYNGDGGGLFWWDVPSITGTIDRMDVWFYCLHTYWNWGAYPVLNFTHALGGGEYFEDHKLGGGNWVPTDHVFPKPGAIQFTLPGAWYPYFLDGANKAIAITFGHTGTTNEDYYMRVDGPSAVLKIWYTQ